MGYHYPIPMSNPLSNGAVAGEGRGPELACNTKTILYDSLIGAFRLSARCALYDNADLGKGDA